MFNMNVYIKRVVLLLSLTVGVFLVFHFSMNSVLHLLLSDPLSL